MIKEKRQLSLQKYFFKEPEEITIKRIRFRFTRSDGVILCVFIKYLSNKPREKEHLEINCENSPLVPLKDYNSPERVEARRKLEELTDKEIDKHYFRSLKRKCTSCGSNELYTDYLKKTSDCLKCKNREVLG